MMHLLKSVPRAASVLRLRAHTALLQQRTAASLSDSDMTYRNRTWIIVEAPRDEPGALRKTVSAFQKHGVNMTHIESRLSSFTHSSPVFHIDFEGRVTDPEVKALVDHLADTCSSVRVMYDRPVPWFPVNIRDLDLTRDTIDAGTGLVNEDHPGFNDAEYRKRRDDLAKTAQTFRHGERIPRVDYTDSEVDTWNAVYSRLRTQHRQHACREYLQSMELMEKHCGYAPNNIPQLADISDYLQTRTGFTIRPVQGLLSARDFLNSLAFRVFYSTQYIRHHGNPFYTPEPDVCHELIGHVPMFADPDFADFSHEIGLASLGASDEDIDKLSTNYWFTVEFGLCKQDGETKAYGAGVLSSFGEIEWACAPTPSEEVRKSGGLDVSLTHPKLVPFDPFVAATTRFPITTYQPTYFVTESMADTKAKIREFCDSLQRPFFPQYDPLTQNILPSRAVRRLKRTSTVDLQAQKQKEYFTKKSEESAEGDAH